MNALAEITKRQEIEEAAAELAKGAVSAALQCLKNFPFRHPTEKSFEVGICAKLILQELGDAEIRGLRTGAYEIDGKKFIGFASALRPLADVETATGVLYTLAMKAVSYGG